MSRAGSSRWSPTPEQLMILEELYRSGIRTPSASQIQHITTHLCFYGRIEGKNVFYWFQNHKARDRQKLRRKLNMQHHLQQQQQQQHYFLGAFDSSHVLLSQGEAEETSEKATTGCRYCIMHDPKTQSVMEKIEKSSLSSSSYCKNYGWSVMDVNIEASSSCTTRPLKTLDLFPTTSTKLKEEESTIISTTFTDKQLYHSVSVHQSI